MLGSMLGPFFGGSPPNVAMIRDTALLLAFFIATRHCTTIKTFHRKYIRALLGLIHRALVLNPQPTGEGSLTSQTIHPKPRCTPDLQPDSPAPEH